MSLLSEISVTIDSREKNTKRINAVKSWAEKHGAIVEVAALPLCDYKIEGTFNEVEMCLGIEAKSLQDFASSYGDLPDKLARSYELYNEVALFIEVGSYTFTPDPDDFHATIINPAVRNGDADVLPLAVFENMIASFQREGIHVRQLRSEAHFPYAIANLLISITKPIHQGLHIKQDKSFKVNYLNVLGKLPHISFKRASKLIKRYPNLFWLCSADESAYQEILGKATGSKLYEFIRCHEFETPEWKNGMHRDGTPKDEPLPEDQDEIDIKVKSAIVEYLKGFSEGRNIEEICLHFNLPQGDFDRQVLHDYIKELAMEGKITSVHSGLFIIAPEISIPEAMAYNGKPQRYTEIPANNTTYAKDGTLEILQSSSADESKISDTGNANKHFPQSSTPDTSSYPGMDFSTGTPQSPPIPVPVDNLPEQRGIISPPPPGDTTPRFANDNGHVYEIKDKCKFATKEKRAACDTPDHFKDTTNLVPQDKKMTLTEHLKIWFQEPHSMMETQLMYGLEGKVGAWSSKSVFDAVLAGEKSGYLRVFPQKGERYYVVAIKEDKELDIGV